ncbi:hypothetical protein CVT26_007689 [Gymnopilus dilepis]|uniref:Uncharacterized protein n=1 Tax=Gymnopilus dilepis TaxID=231916 RepID=A0A409WSG2_9AGAR|nr:hypothetical protein CVT26_007689 [Gymnopilus dilepis]
MPLFRASKAFITKNIRTEADIKEHEHEEKNDKEGDRGTVNEKDGQSGHKQQKKKKNEITRTIRTSSEGIPTFSSPDKSIEHRHVELHAEGVATRVHALCRAFPITPGDLEPKDDTLVVHLDADPKQHQQDEDQERRHQRRSRLG